MGPAIALRNEKGELFCLRPSSLMVFLDETGQEGFKDPQYPVFGLGACATLAHSYESNIRIPWIELKRLHFGGEDAPLHAVELRSSAIQQIQAVARFFQSQRFYRLAVTITDRSEFHLKINPYHIVLRKILDFIAAISQYQRYQDAVFIFEDSKRGNRLAKKYFGPYNISDGTSDIPIMCGFMIKQECEPGLEVADFVAQASGGQALAESRGYEGIRKDFKAIFVGVGQQFSSNLHIRGIAPTEANGARS